MAIELKRRVILSYKRQSVMVRPANSYPVEIRADGERIILSADEAESLSALLRDALRTSSGVFL